MLPTGYIAKPKARRRRRPLQIDRIEDAMAPGGVREICRTRGAWELRRAELCTRAEGRCEGVVECCGMVRCNCRAPLHATEACGISIPAGEAHHLTKRKVRNDSLANLQWLCRRCHSAAEVPAKVVPKKEKR